MSDTSTKAQLIMPRVLKGFRDYPPSVMMARVEMIRKLQAEFVNHGFAPIDTPALEYADILLGKGSEETDKQLFRFQDKGGRDVAMRFDLTVPLARFAAMNINELGTPFRRYHIAPVWRAEKPQRGRFREFVQCDFDIIGSDSILADAEILVLVHDAFKALGIDHQLRVNNRLILNGLLETLGARDYLTLVLRAIDKLEKLGEDVVKAELVAEANLTSAQVQQILAFVHISNNAGSPKAIVSELEPILKSSAIGQLGLQQLSQLSCLLDSYELREQDWKIDLSIARGLDYYTGTVFETQFRDLPEIGSICSGGRYDNLASLYTKQKLPGVGGSIGLDRVIAGLEELGRISSKMSPTAVLVCVNDERYLAFAAQVAKTLRSKDIATELYPKVCSLKHQLKYADRKQIDYVVMISIDGATLSVKNMKSGEQLDNLQVGDLLRHF